MVIFFPTAEVILAKILLLLEKTKLSLSLFESIVKAAINHTGREEPPEPQQDGGGRGYLCLSCYSEGSQLSLRGGNLKPVEKKPSSSPKRGLQEPTEHKFSAR